MRNDTLMLIILLVLGVFVAAILFQPAPGRPNVSITLLGCTNDATGARLATFAFTNLGASSVMIYRPLISVPDPAQPSGLAPDATHHQMPWTKTLGRGMSATLTIPTPTNLSPWKLTFLVYSDVDPAQEIKRVITRSPRHMPTGFQSDWFDDGK